MARRSCCAGHRADQSSRLSLAICCDGGKPSTSSAARNSTRWGLEKRSRSSRLSTSESSARSRPGPSTALMTRLTGLRRRKAKILPRMSATRNGSPSESRDPEDESNHGEQRQHYCGDAHGARDAPGGAAAHAVSACASSPERTPSPSSARSSRRSSCGRSSATAAWRARTTSGVAGLSSQCASVSSPTRVRALESNSKSDP